MNCKLEQRERLREGGLSLGGGSSPNKAPWHIEGQRRSLKPDAESLREDAKVEFKNVYIKKLRERYRAGEGEDRSGALPKGDSSFAQKNADLPGVGKSKLESELRLVSKSIMTSLEVSNRS